MGKVKITVTIEETLIEELDRWAGEQRQSRSRIVEDAVVDWQRRRREAALIEGYQAMAEEDVDTAEAALQAGFETTA